MVRSIGLFVVAALAEIGGVFLIWRGLREGDGGWTAVAGVLALVVYGLLATLQPQPHFGRVLAAYGGVFVAGSLLWAVALDHFKPDRFDVFGSLACLFGAGLIIWGPR